MQDRISFVRNYSGMKTTCFIKKWEEKNKSKGNNQIFRPLGSSLKWCWSSAGLRRNVCTAALQRSWSSPEGFGVSSVLSSMILGLVHPAERAASCFALRASPVQQLWKTDSLDWNEAGSWTDNPFYRQSSSFEMLLDLLSARQILGGIERSETASVFQWKWTYSS